MNIFNKTTFVRFCCVSASMLPEELGLSTEQLICLYKECIEVTKHCYDKSTTFVSFCFASASMLPEGLGLSTEQLICLYKECIEMAKHCNDISTTFGKFCFASAYMLPEEPRLSTEQLFCLCKETIEMAKHCNDISTTMNSCMQFVVHSNSLGRHSDSLRCLKEISPLAVAKPCYELIVHRCYSFTYRELNEFENVVLHAKKTIEIAQTIGDRKNGLCGHYDMGLAFLYLARYDDAIDCGKKCLKIAQEIDSTEDESYAYFCIMLAYKSMQKYDDTILYAHKVLDCAMRNNNQKIMIKAYSELGRAHLALNHYRDAIDFGQKCIEIAREIEDRSGEVKAYLLMGQIYDALSDYDNAIIYCKKCIELAITISDKNAEVHAYNLLGDICYYSGKYDDAIPNCNKRVVMGRHADSLRCLEEILPFAEATPSHELIVHKCLSVTYRDQNEFQNAVLHAKKWIEISQTISDKEREMYGHCEMGIAYLCLARYDDAIDCGKKCLTIAQEIDSAEGEMEAYNLILVAYKNMQKYDDSILYAHKFLDCAMKNNNQEAMMNAYLKLGGAHFALNHYQDATDFGKKCIEIAREIEDRRVEVKAYLLMGQIYNALSDYDNAIIYCKKCIELAISIGDKVVEAHAYSLLGNIYYSLEKYDDAISNCNKCVHIDKEDIEEKSAHVTAYLTLGKVYRSLEKNDEAIQNYQQCIDIVNRFGLVNRADMAAYLGLGEICLIQEQYSEAVRYIKKCIDMAQKTGEKIIEAQACLVLSSAYQKSDDKESIDNAIQYGKKCLDISQEIGDKKTEMEGYHCLAQAYMDSCQLTEVYQSIDAGMTIATELGDKEAEENFKEIRFNLYSTVGLFDKCYSPSVMELLEVPTCSEDELLQDLDQAVKTGKNKEKLRALTKLYKFYDSKNDYVKTINYFEQLKKMDLDRSLNLLCFTKIGNLYHLMGQNEKALHSFKQGLPTAESCSENDRQLSKFYHCFGQLLYSLNRDLNLAERYLKGAIRCFEAIFTALGSRDEFKISIFDQYIRSYKLLAILLIHGKQIKEALLVLDRCRARALKDLMISNFKMEQEESNDERLEYSDVLSLVSRNDFSIAYYSLYLDAFLKFFIEGETNSHYSGCPYHSLQIDVDRLFDEMGVREVVDCENRSLDKEEDIQKEQSRSKEEYEEFKQPTALLLNLDSNRGESTENSAETKGSTLEDLFDILECDTILSSKQDEVVIIPEGPLYKVPFPALRDRRTGKYLSETKRIRLAPSLATLKALQERTEDYYSKKGALIVGNPLVGKVMFDGEEKEFDPLDNAFAEVIAVGNVFNATPLTGQKATKQAVIQRLKEGVSVVHIAAHGSLTKGTIALAPSPEVRATKIPDEQDYMLTMADVQQAKVRAQLVVLSCCHSGRGKIRAEGVVSMCRAFLASGARAVVASLWAIDDGATCDFMFRFYTRLMDRKSASVSLQQAMNEMRNSSGFNEPYYWAPFFLMGEDVTINC